MIRDILFVFMVLSVTVYAHSYKSTIIDFIEVSEEEEEESSLLEETYLQASLKALL